MIGVLTLFGESDLQPELKKAFVQNDLMFTCKKAETSVQLLSFLEENIKETDAVVIAADAVVSGALFELFDTIKEIKKSIRIVVILNGGREQYLKKQLSGFRQRQIDIVFDDRGFDAETLIRFLKKGPVKVKEEVPVVETDEQVILEDEDAINAEKILENTPEPEVVETEETTKVVEMPVIDEPIEDDESDSFSDFRGHYSIGIMGASHGTGVTRLAVALGEYFALHNCSVALVDYTGTDALALAKVKDADRIFESQSTRQLKKKYNIVILDFGAPYSITPKGDNFIVENGYPIMNLPEFNKCNIKIIMGFSDSWNIRKLRFFLDNEQWKSVINSSFLFLTADGAEKLKRTHPGINILNRNDNVRDIIYEIIKREEMK